MQQRSMPCKASHSDVTYCIPESPLDSPAPEAEGADAVAVQLACIAARSKEERGSHNLQWTLP